MTPTQALEKQVITLRSVADEIDKIAESNALRKTALSTAAENVRLSAKYLQVVIRLMRTHDDVQKARAVTGAS